MPSPWAWKILCTGCPVLLIALFGLYLGYQTSKDCRAPDIQNCLLSLPPSKINFTSLALFCTMDTAQLSLNIPCDTCLGLAIRIFFDVNEKIEETDRFGPDIHFMGTVVKFFVRIHYCRVRMIYIRFIHHTRPTSSLYISVQLSLILVKQSNESYPRSNWKERLVFFQQTAQHTLSCISMWWGIWLFI